MFVDSSYTKQGLVPPAQPDKTIWDIPRRFYTAETMVWEKNGSPAAAGSTVVDPPGVATGSSDPTQECPSDIPQGGLVSQEQQHTLPKSNKRCTTGELFLLPNNLLSVYSNMGVAPPSPPPKKAKVTDIDSRFVASNGSPQMSFPTEGECHDRASEPMLEDASQTSGANLAPSGVSRVQNDRDFDSVFSSRYR